MKHVFSLLFDMFWDEQHIISLFKFGVVVCLSFLRLSVKLPVSFGGLYEMVCDMNTMKIWRGNKLFFSS